MSASNTSRQYIVTQFYSNGIDLSDYIVKETIVKHTYPNGDVIQYCLYTNDQYGILYYSPFYKSIKRIFFEDKDTLGHAMGKEFRASLAVTDAGFAKGIRKHLDTEEG